MTIYEPRVFRQSHWQAFCSRLVYLFAPLICAIKSHSIIETKTQWRDKFGQREITTHTCVRKCGYGQ